MPEPFLAESWRLDLQCLEAIWELGEKAAFTEILNHFKERQGKNPNVPAVLGAVQRLNKNGFVRVRWFPKKGFWPSRRNLLRLDPAGLQLIGKSQSIPPITGQTLAARIAQGPLPVEEIIFIGIGICFELGYAHKQGILHGNITAENILVAADTEVRLLNFEENPQGDEQTDIQAVGFLLREMLAGRNTPELLHAVAQRVVISRDGPYCTSADKFQNVFENLRHALRRDANRFRDRIIFHAVLLTFLLLLFHWIYERIL